MVIYKQKLLKWMLFGYGGLMLLLIGLSTAARFLNSDVLFQDGLWAIALDIVTAIVDVFAFAFASAVVIYGIYAVGARNMTTVFSAFFSVTVFHYVAILGIGWAIYPGTLPETVEDWLRMALESLVLYILLDCLRLFIVGFVTAKLLAKREAARNDYNRKAKIMGDELQDQRSIAFPFSKFVSIKNPVQVGVLVTAATYWAVFAVQYVYYGAMNLIKLKFWEYIGFQIMELVFYAIMAWVCYCIATFILIKLDEKMPKSE